MACTTTRGTDGAVIAITCTRAPAAPLSREAAALLAHFEGTGLVSETARPARPAAPAVEELSLFDLDA